MCTGSTNYAKCLQTMHNVYRLYSGKCVCAQCLQTTQIVYKLCTYTYTRVRRIYVVYAYMRIHVYVFPRVNIHIWREVDWVVENPAPRAPETIFHHPTMYTST